MIIVLKSGVTENRLRIFQRNFQFMAFPSTRGEVLSPQSSVLSVIQHQLI